LFCHPIGQWFPTFFWSRTTWGQVLSPCNNLFQEDSIYQRWFNQKFRKLDLTQKRHIKWRWETNGHCWKLIEIVHRNVQIYKQSPTIKSKNFEYGWFVKKQKIGLLKYHLEGLCIPLVVCVPQFGNHCYRLLSLWHKIQTVFCKMLRLRQPPYGGNNNLCMWFKSLEFCNAIRKKICKMYGLLQQSTAICIFHLHQLQES